jgi:hypothetical protein
LERAANSSNWTGNCEEVWKEQRTAATGQRIVRKFVLCDEILKDKKGPFSRHSSVFNFFYALPLLHLDVGDDDPDDRPIE